MSDLNSLPVAPEFVEVLAENATLTAVNYLQAIHAPEQVIQLVKSISALDYYVTECFRSPETITRDRNDRYDIESIVIESINAIAQCGGMFQGPYNDSLPRPLPTPELVKGKAK